MEYLTLWRMQIAARLLADGCMKVASVGREIGYDSEAAFSRAFKKIIGLSPAAWALLEPADPGSSSGFGRPRMRAAVPANRMREYHNFPAET